MHLRCWFARKMSQFTRFCGVKFLAWKSGCVNFLTNSMSVHYRRKVFCCFFGILCSAEMAYLVQTSSSVMAALWNGTTCKTKCSEPGFWCLQVEQGLKCRQLLQFFIAILERNNVGWCRWWLKFASNLKLDVVL